VIALWETSADKTKISASKLFDYCKLNLHNNLTYAEFKQLNGREIVTDSEKLIGFDPIRKVLRVRHVEKKSEETLKKTWAKMDPKNTGKIKLGFFVKVFTTMGEEMSTKEIAEVLGDKTDLESMIDF